MVAPWSTARQRERALSFYLLDFAGINPTSCELCDNARVCFRLAAGSTALGQKMASAVPGHNAQEHRTVKQACQWIPVLPAGTELAVRTLSTSQTAARSLACPVLCPDPRGKLWRVGTERTALRVRNWCKWLHCFGVCPRLEACCQGGGSVWLPDDTRALARRRSLRRYRSQHGMPPCGITESLLGAGNAMCGERPVNARRAHVAERFQTLTSS